jgi:2-amino-4-hydroxy-6-hydroxymethyldihydropteridine diphosphokinase
MSDLADAGEAKRAQQPLHGPEILGSAATIVALGSNLGDRRATIHRAIGMMEVALGPCLARSRLIETEAWIHPDDDADWHPPFLNGVALFETALEPPEVLQHLLAIETALGRQRNAHAKPWQPRPIDLDLIGVGDAILHTAALVLPHPRMHERRFVLEPLASLLPDWRHPILNRTASELLEAHPD